MLFLFIYFYIFVDLVVNTLKFFNYLKVSINQNVINN
jgi:hypothetical protein